VSPRRTARVFLFANIDGQSSGWSNETGAGTGGGQSRARVYRMCTHIRGSLAMSNGARRQGETGRLPVVNYTVGLAWPAPPQIYLYNFLEGSNSSVKRDPKVETAPTRR